ncbi:hypothetical protein SLEP1_g9852 [Rubroshorea leprosula]|uniref:1-phosphatidylinositol 4-kinase n=1 Tax=Rubroshorea leprosula TaxID=152421 RepID=A0AAV5IH77_9ROSI|nr:hypothetical protein SLEP1_g9852 [Rubroshorea leprosula]
MSSAGVVLSPVHIEPILSPCQIDPYEPMLSPCRMNSERVLCQMEPISIFLTFSRSTVPMRVLESDSIESVKLRIQNCTGFVVRNQKLVCKGRELARSNSLVREYGVTDGNVLHLVIRLSDIQVINVRTVCGKEFLFHVGRGRNVGYVKRQIAKSEKEFDNLDEQEVLCDGKQVEDQMLIDDICKPDDAVLHLLVCRTAKVRVRPVEKNIELSIVAPKPDDRRDYVAGEKKTRRQCDAAEDCSRGYEAHEEIVPRKLPDRDFFVDPVTVNPMAPEWDHRSADVTSEKKNGRHYDAAEDYSRYDEVDSTVVPTKPPHMKFFFEPISNPKVELPSVMEMINSTSYGLDGGNHPIRSMEGTGGAYFMQDATGQKFVSVFKPIDEEPLAVNNPRGLPPSPDGEGLKKGTRVGEGAVKEMAAYVLDHPKGGLPTLFGDEKGFAGVPPTVLIKCGHSAFNNPDDVTAKLGSLQMFMENSGSCEDIGPGAFPVEEVHKICVLDIRLANADRHAGNILLSEDADGKTLLIPIDHGYCLPRSFEDCTFEWLYWPQAHQPFSLETINYIKSLDAEEDIALLKDHGWDMPLECARTLHISTMLLKKGVDKGLTPYAIGSMMCRESLNKESIIEEIVQETKDSILPGASEALFLETLSHIMDRHLDEIARSYPQ